jgi:hypothetical protein
MEISAEKQARGAIGAYLDSVKAQYTDIAALRVILEEHRCLSKEADTRILDLEKERGEVEKNLKKEGEDPTVNNKKQLSRKVSINVLAEREGKLTFSIKYRKTVLFHCLFFS